MEHIRRNKNRKRSELTWLTFRIENPKNCSDSVGWSDEIQFRTPPVGGSEELKFLAFGDMGKAPLDMSAEHYIQV